MFSVTPALLYLSLLSLPFLGTAAPAWSSLDQASLHDSSSTSSDIRAALKKAEVIPDVLDSFHPSFSISIKYPKTHANVKLGNTLSPSAVSSAPNIILQPLPSSKILNPTPTLKTNVTYTLAMTDPDATSHAHPVMGEMCHWIVTGISIPKTMSDQPTIVGSAYIGIGDIKLSSPDTSNSNITELMSYLPPSPPPKTGLHRYVFVFLASTASEDFSIVAGLKKPKERPHWGYGEIGKGVKDWAIENGLVVVGANWFYAQNEQQ